MKSPTSPDADGPHTQVPSLAVPCITFTATTAAAAGDASGAAARAAAAATVLDFPPTPLTASEHLRDASLPNAVHLNVYDIMGGNSFLWSVGWGMHHVGVQVFGKEYQYGYCEHGKGIGHVEPRHSPPHIFRETFCLGQTELSQAAVEKVVEGFCMQDCWLGSNYRVVHHNCIDFAQAFSEALLPPAVRVAQANQAENAGLEKQQMEEVTVDGVRHAVPVLIPPHVGRLSRHAARLLPKGAWERLDAAHLPISSVSEAHHE